MVHHVQRVVEMPAFVDAALGVQFLNNGVPGRGEDVEHDGVYLVLHGEVDRVFDDILCIGVCAQRTSVSC